MIWKVKTLFVHMWKDNSKTTTIHFFTKNFCRFLTLSVSLFLSVAVRLSAVSVVVGVLWQGGVLRLGESDIPVMFLDSLLHRSASFIDLNLPALKGNLIDYAILFSWVGGMLRVYTRCNRSVVSMLLEISVKTEKQSFNQRLCKNIITFRKQLFGNFFSNFSAFHSATIRHFTSTIGEA